MVTGFEEMITAAGRVFVVGGGISLQGMAYHTVSYELVDDGTLWEARFHAIEAIEPGTWVYNDNRENTIGESSLLSSL